MGNTDVSTDNNYCTIVISQSTWNGTPLRV